MGFQQELATAREYGISPAVLVEQILPVANKARKVSRTVPEYFINATHTNISNHPFREYIIRHGFGYAVVTSNDMPVYFCLIENGKDVLPTLEEIARLQRDERSQYQLTEMEGNLLGYPSCCITAFIDDRRKHALETKRIREQLLCGNFVRQTDSSFQVKSGILPAFFTPGFYPCKPECESAIEIGNRVLSSLHDEEYEAYSRGLLNNAIWESLDIGSLILVQKPDKTKELYRRLMENEPVIQEMPVVLI